MNVQFLDQNNPESEISARREILKPFKKTFVGTIRRH